MKLLRLGRHNLLSYVTLIRGANGHVKVRGILLRHQECFGATKNYLRHDLLCNTPKLRHQVVHLGIMLLQLSTIKWKEIVLPKIGFG